MCTVHRTMHPGTGSDPPLRPVPEPRVTTGVFVRWARRRTAWISAAVRTNTTQPGCWVRAAVPSKA